MAPPNLSLETVEVFRNVSQFRQDKYVLLSQNGPREFRSTISVHLSLNLRCSVSRICVTFLSIFVLAKIIRKESGSRVVDLTVGCDFLGLCVEKFPIQKL